jgi:hypothetical protein
LQKSCKSSQQSLLFLQLVEPSVDFHGRKACRLVDRRRALLPLSPPAYRAGGTCKAVPAPMTALAGWGIVVITGMAREEGGDLG